MQVAEKLDWKGLMQQNFANFYFPTFYFCVIYLFIYLFTCSLLNNALSNSDYIALMRDLNLLFQTAITWHIYGPAFLVILWFKAYFTPSR
jgi:hypothetical protein